MTTFGSSGRIVGRPAIVVLMLLALALTSCGPPAHGNEAGLMTVIDSTADSIFVRTHGSIAPNNLRSLVEDLRIAPAMDDTSLFTAVGTFQVDRSGRFWVYDRPTNSILIFDENGGLVRRVGRQGGGPGEFYSNNGMAALADGGMAVLDSRNGRISFLDAEGGFRRSWVVTTGFSTSNGGLVGDRSGALFLVRPVTPPRDGEILGRMGLVRPAEDGSLSDSLIPPELPVPREAYVAERKESGGGVSRSATSVPNGAQYFWAWAPDGYFVVAHGGKYEIHPRPHG